QHVARRRPAPADRAARSHNLKRAKRTTSHSALFFQHASNYGLRMDVMMRRRTRIRRQGSGLAGVLALAMVAFGMVGPVAAAPAPPAENHDPSAVGEDELTIAQGDALVPGHSFEDGLEGWTLTDGHGGSPAAACPETLSVTQ